MKGFLPSPIIYVIVYGCALPDVKIPRVKRVLGLCSTAKPVTTYKNASQNKALSYIIHTTSVGKRMPRGNFAQHVVRD